MIILSLPWVECGDEPVPGDVDDGSQVLYVITEGIFCWYADLIQTPIEKNTYLSNVGIGASLQSVSECPSSNSLVQVSASSPSV